MKTWKDKDFEYHNAASHANAEGLARFRKRQRARARALAGTPAAPSLVLVPKRRAPH